MTGLFLTPLLAVMSPPPVVEVFTMGPQEDMFARFGHAAICITTPKTSRGRCYNYGTADFSTPGPLTWRFIRGKAQFWVSVVHKRPMLDFYRKSDRTVWRQRLVLTSDQAHQIARQLASSALEANRYYRYHHFEDNCSTRIRDVLNDALGGALRRSPPGSTDRSFRDHAIKGFAGAPFLQIAALVVLGRSTDRPISRWQAMFHPDDLRREVQSRLQAEPHIMYERQGPRIEGSTRSGSITLIGAGLLLALLIVAAPRAFTPAFVAISTLLGGALWFLAVASDLSELRFNEVLLVLIPLDGLILSKIGRHYAAARLATLLIIGLLAVLEVLVQPLAAPLIFIAAPLAAASWRMNSAR